MTNLKTRLATLEARRPPARPLRIVRTVIDEKGRPLCQMERDANGVYRKTQQPGGKS